jgi:type I restriction enzyme R subunit
MPHRGTETEFELTTIERLEDEDYIYIHGEELERPHEDVVLKDRLHTFLASRYSDLPDAAIDEAVARFARPEGADTLRRNLNFHREVTRGVNISYELADGTKKRPARLPDQLG